MEYLFLLQDKEKAKLGETSQAIFSLFKNPL